MIRVLGNAARLALLEVQFKRVGKIAAVITQVTFSLLNCGLAWPLRVSLSDNASGRNKGTDHRTLAASEF